LKPRKKDPICSAHAEDELAAYEHRVMGELGLSFVEDAP
jgi:hypothetical protein